MSVCPECGAPVPEGGSCRDHFYALLVLEGGFPGAPGSILHFYAVASYNLQHPDSSEFTAETLRGSYRNLADVLDGKLTLEALRRQVRQAANGPTRVRRRPGEPAPPWHRGPWPITVVDVLAATAANYPALIEGWARAVRQALDHAQ
jgi:Family of unknown function (DUF5946)